MSTYIHELPEWPRFRWDHEALATPLAGARHRQGRLLGQMEALGFKVREQAVLRALTDDVQDHFLTILTNGKVTTDGVGAHSDLLPEFPYLGPPHNT